MPIKRKICKIGTGLAVFLPKSWVQLLEKKHGKVEAVAIEVDDALVLTPIFEEDSKDGKLTRNDTFTGRLKTAQRLAGKSSN
ncbi:hypothetical protein KEJ37_05670 [Candidatus Bathyarchaeota archaeon]|nr:hypothetical protein [Candidatus Bathyarchaeota archaeon]